MLAYARKAGDLEFAWWATELKLDAERKGTRADLTSATSRQSYDDTLEEAQGVRERQPPLPTSHQKQG